MLSPLCCVLLLKAKREVTVIKMTICNLRLKENTDYKEGKHINLWLVVIMINGLLFTVISFQSMD